MQKAMSAWLRRSREKLAYLLRHQGNGHSFDHYQRSGEAVQAERLQAHEATHAVLALACGLDVVRGESGLRSGVVEFLGEHGSESLKAACYLGGLAGERALLGEGAMDAVKSFNVERRIGSEKGDVTMALPTLQSLAKSMGSPKPNIFTADLAVQFLSEMLFSDGEFARAVEKIRKRFSGGLGEVSGLAIRNEVRRAVDNWEKFCGRIQTLAEAAIEAAIAAD